MGLKTFTVDYRELSKDFFLRSDFDYFEIKNKLNLDRVPKLKKYLTFLETGKPITPEDYSEDETDNVHIVVRNIADGEFKENNLIFISDDKAEELEKYRIQENDIVIAISSNCGYSFYYDGKDKRNLTLSHYLARFRIDQLFINPIFLNYYINSRIMKQYFRSVETGKTLKNLSKYYIKQLPVLIPDKHTQDKIVLQVEPIEKKIKDLKSKIAPQQVIINKVLSREFGFDKNLFNEFGKGMTAGTQIAQNKSLRVFETNFDKLSRSAILRSSTRYHNPPTHKLMTFLDSIDTVKVKDVIETYEKGLQPKYNTDGEIPVIKIANLKNGFIDFSETENITQEDYDKLEDKKKLKQNDIIICCTGKISLGKIDYFSYENEAITSVDNYILRLNKKYNPLFFTYFFRCILGYFQIERDYTGATNQIHLYWDQISNFQIPNTSLESQQKIVDEIKSELNKQEEIKKKIESERNKIDEIIENAIR